MKLFNRMIDSLYVAWYVWVFVLVSVMAYAILAAFSGAAR